MEFMLEIIKKLLEELTKNVAEEAKKNSGAVQDKLLELLKLDNKISAKSVANPYFRRGKYENNSGVLHQVSENTWIFINE